MLAGVLGNLGNNNEMHDVIALIIGFGARITKISERGVAYLRSQLLDLQRPQVIHDLNGSSAGN